MRYGYLAIAACLLVAANGCGQPGVDIRAAADGQPTDEITPVVQLEDQVVEAACGQCKFAMDGSGCDLAVRINGDGYYVDGTSIDDHGDAHAPDGMCETIRQARVSGTVKEGRFEATSFELVPSEGG